MRAGKENLMHVADKRLKNISALLAHCKSSCAENLEKVVKTNMKTVSSNKEILDKHTPLVAYMSVVPLIYLCPFKTKSFWISTEFFKLKKELDFFQKRN